MTPSRIASALRAIIAAAFATALLSAPAALASNASATVYYVSPSGSDANNGQSPASPWQTMCPVNRVNSAPSWRYDGQSYTYSPGASVEFLGGQSFHGPVSSCSLASSTLSPWGGVSNVTYSSYGAGQATLADGVYLKSVSGLSITNLNITRASGAGVLGAGQTSGITLSNDTITSTYNTARGGYGVQGSQSDTDWAIEADTITNTMDSGVFSTGSDFTITANTFANNGIGNWCGTGPGQNPCHGVYAKGPDFTITNNTITNPQASGISLRHENNTVQGNTITGGQRGITFNSETSTPGTTYILHNTISGQSDTGIELYNGLAPLYESFVIASNTMYDTGAYDLYAQSGPNSSSSQTISLANNLFQAPPAGAYVNLAGPTAYTKRTYTEQGNLFYGSAQANPWFVNGSARPFSSYVKWFGAGAEGTGDGFSNPLLNPSTLTPASGSPALGKASANDGALGDVSYDCQSGRHHLCDPDIGSR